MADDSQDKSGKGIEEQIGWTLGKGFSFLRSAGRKLEKTATVKDIKRAFEEEMEREDEPPEPPKKESAEKKPGSTRAKKKSTSRPKASKPE